MSREIVTKIPVEAYKIRPPQTASWAVITIHEPAGPQTGTMMIHSDYGDWAYTWHEHGCKSFKHFILDLSKDEGYLVKKLTNGAQEYDPEATGKAVVETLDRDVRDGMVTEKAKRLFLEELDVDGFPSDQYDLVNGLEAILDRIDVDMTSTESNQLREVILGSDGIPIRYRNDSACCDFFEKIFVPHFVPTIQAELEGKKP